MITIPVRAAGDCWLNPDQVTQLLNTAAVNEPIELDFYYEAPCIKRIGLLDILKQARTQNIRINRWTNLAASPAPYPLGPRDLISHFLRNATEYWTADIPTLTNNACQFGLFLGRDTVARNNILYDVAHNYADLFLLSKLKQTYIDPWNPPLTNRFVNLELDDAWGDGQHIVKWLATNPVGSIDNRHQQDQYSKGYQVTVPSLLSYYDRFCIELVCESYTLGDTFFITEKTARPLMAAKPVIVYGPRHFLKNMQRFGFETYAACWNESYDELEGYQRWQAIKQLLPTIQPSDLAQGIAQRNRNRLAELIGYKNI